MPGPPKHDARHREVAANIAVEHFSVPGCHLIVTLGDNTVSTFFTQDLYVQLKERSQSLSEKTCKVRTSKESP